MHLTSQFIHQRAHFQSLVWKGPDKGFRCSSCCLCNLKETERVCVESYCSTVRY